MKKSVLFIFLVTICLAGFAQKDSTQTPPYKRYPTLPPLRLLLVDSSTYFTKADFKKKTNVMIMLFNPECEHCQHETRDLIKNIDGFKDIQIVMATMMPFDSMKKFYQKYELGRFGNISVGKDLAYFLPSFYMISNLPYLAFYDKNGKLIDAVEGSLPIEKALAEFADH